MNCPKEDVQSPIKLPENSRNAETRDWCNRGHVTRSSVGEDAIQPMRVRARPTPVVLNQRHPAGFGHVGASLGGRLGEPVKC